MYDKSRTSPSSPPRVQPCALLFRCPAAMLVLNTALQGHDLYNVDLPFHDTAVFRRQKLLKLVAADSFVANSSIKRSISLS